MKALKRVVSILLMLATLLCGCGAQTEGAEDNPSSGESPVAEVPEALPAFEPLDWSTVEDAPAEDFTYELKQGTDPVTGESGFIVHLISYNGDDNIIKVPDKIEGCCVTRANNDLFRGNTAITYVCLPAYLDAVYMAMELDNFFQNCTSLLQVQMPLDCISVPMAMFDNCTSLRDVSFPTSKESGFYPTEIEKYAFRGCTSLTSIDLSEHITAVNDSAFEGCTRLVAIHLDSVESIGSDAFEGCTSLKSVIAPKAKFLGGEVFKDCVNLTELTLCAYNGSHSYSDRLGSAFNGCCSLETIMFAPYESDHDKYLTVENGILYRITEEGDGSTSSELLRVLEYYREEEIILREDVATIGSYAFYNIAFTNYEIPASVQKVETRAFINCPNLESVSEEKSSDFIYVDTDAFDYCPVLKVIDLSARPWENTHRYEDDLYGYDCPAIEKVVFPGEDPNAAPVTKDGVTAAIEAVFEIYADKMDAAGFTYEITCKGNALSQVMIYTNKQDASSSDSELLKEITMAILEVPEADLDAGLEDQIRSDPFNGFGYFNRYFSGPDKIELGQWEEKGCLVIITNN